MAENKLIDIIYDGECPICKHFVLKRNVEQNGYQLNLINARGLSPQQIRDYRQRGFDLNKGMLARYQDKEYFANDALTLLLSVSRHSGRPELFIESGYLRVNSPGLYRILVKLRLFLLKCLGKRPL